MGDSTQLTDLPVDAFLERLGSSDPVPGGGSASALVAAMGAALVAMVAELTIGRPEYAEHEATVRKLRFDALDRRAELMSLAQQDADAYDAVVQARRLPKGSEPEREARRDALGKAMIDAARAPLRAAVVASEVLDLAERIAPIGNRRAVSDAGVAALLAAAAGLLLAVLLSSWAAARVTKPVEELAHAAHEIAGGNWNARVTVNSNDEIGELADSFNRMTRDLLDQRERLVQAERVAAWRELARRLAHELKNPLFPLQLTVENLLRAREHGQQQFDETFRESATTLLTEIANLKTIVGRFSEFSKMPQPQFQEVRLNELVEDVAKLHQAQLNVPGRPAIECRLELSAAELIAADPDLLHRALSNLVLNAIEAMPQGGKLTLRTRQVASSAYIEVADTGPGMAEEDCARIFTPYYTNKARGTGLGLAIVQSIVSDHGGRISVSSARGQGTTFIIELPANADKLSAAGTHVSGRDA